MAHRTGGDRVPAGRGNPRTRGMIATCHPCRCAMVEVRRGPVRMWRCENCNAHALTVPSLRRIMPGEVWTEVWPAIRAAASPGSRRCPVCEQSMDLTAALPRLGGMRLDICDPCRLLYLDPSELEKLPKVPVEEETDAMPPEAREAMARAMVELYKAESEAREEALFGPIRDSALALLFALARGISRT